jgi:GDP-L-fucose synthase
MERHDRILVTGAAGLVGSSLVRVLSEKGFKNVVSLTRHHCDLMDSNDVSRFFSETNPDYVFHTAGRVYGVGGNLINKGLVFYENLIINTNVIEACRKVSVRKLVAFGTGAVYPHPPRRVPLNEDFIFDGPPHQSEDSYSHAKRAMLAMLQAYHQSYGLQYAYLVCGNQYGPNDRFNPLTGHVVPSLIAKFAEARRTGGDVMVWGDGSAIRDFTYVDDTSRAALEVMMRFDGPINIASGIEVTIRDVVNEIADISGLADRVQWDSTKPNGREYLGYDLSRLRSLNFECQNSLREGLEKTWNWYVKQGVDGLRM